MYVMQTSFDKLASPSFALRLFVKDLDKNRQIHANQASNKGPLNGH